MRSLPAHFLHPVSFFLNQIRLKMSFLLHRFALKKRKRFRHFPKGCGSASSTGRLGEFYQEEQGKPHACVRTGRGQGACLSQRGHPCGGTQEGRTEGADDRCGVSTSGQTPLPAPQPPPPPPSSSPNPRFAPGPALTDRGRGSPPLRSRGPWVSQDRAGNAQNKRCFSTWRPGEPTEVPNRSCPPACEPTHVPHSPSAQVRPCSGATARGSLCLWWGGFPLASLLLRSLPAGGPAPTSSLKQASLTLSTPRLPSLPKAHSLCTPSPTCRPPNF